MYGFGDAKTPLPESVAILEDIVCEFITKMVCPGWVALACRPTPKLQTMAARADAACVRVLEQTKEAVKLSNKRGKKLVSARWSPCCPVGRSCSCVTAPDFRLTPPVSSPNVLSRPFVCCRLQALEDILLLVRKHPQMYYRARELNRLEKEVKAIKSTSQAEVKQMGAA